MNVSRASFDDGSQSAGARLVRQVAFGRALMLATLIAGLLFLWPLLAYGRPGDFQDSAAYYKGGKAAVGFVLDKLHLQAPAPIAAPPGGGTAGPTEDGQAAPVRGGARSVAYSVAAYVLGAPSAQMWLLAAAQAFAAGFICAVGLLLFGADLRSTTAKLAVLAIATPVAFVSCVLVPDIFAGLVIFAITLLAAAYKQLSPGVRTALILIGIAGIAFHASHLPLGLGMTALGGGWMVYRMRRAAWNARGQWACLLAPFVFGALMTSALNFVAFGGPSLTGKRFPLTLARSIEEGPGRWYLDRNCGHLKYAVCEVYPHGVPGTISTFLWGPTGVKERATPEQMDRIRAEESEVVMAAARAYPLQEIGRLGRQYGRQLVLFRPGLGLDNRIILDSAENPVLVPARYDPLWVKLVGYLSMASVLASLVVLGLRWRSMPALRPLSVLAIAGILMNAAICVFFSGVTDRYQARVIWLIPLLALMALSPAGVRRDETPAESR